MSVSQPQRLRTARVAATLLVLAAVLAGAALLLSSVVYLTLFRLAGVM